MTTSVTKERMNSIERKALFGLATLYAFRMMGLFMVLPVMMTYGEVLRGSTAGLLGLALGAYGITQSVFQIPLGWLSDRIGRKPVIAGGLIVFALGSVLAALSDSMFWVIMGRILQGSGAIASSTMALLTDLTREQFRTKALAFVGITIGLSFTVSMMLGPWIALAWGISGIFWLSALMSICGLVVLAWLVPDAPQNSGRLSNGHFLQDAKRVLTIPDLLRLNFGIFSLHMGLMATFIVVPLRLVAGGLSESLHGWLYAPVMVLAFVLMIPFMVIGEKKQLLVPMFSGAIGLLIVVQFLFITVGEGWAVIGLLLVLYFMAFNYLEAAMPSLLSRLVPLDIKGTAMGVFNTSQFIGAAIGGVVGGALFERYGFTGVFSGLALLLAFWLLVSLGQKMPESIKQLVIQAPEPRDGDIDWVARISESLLLLDGVEFVEIHEENREAHVHYKPAKITENTVKNVIHSDTKITH